MEDSPILQIILIIKILFYLKNNNNNSWSFEQYVMDSSFGKDSLVTTMRTTS